MAWDGCPGNNHYLSPIVSNTGLMGEYLFRNGAHYSPLILTFFLREKGQSVGTISEPLRCVPGSPIRSNEIAAARRSYRFGCNPELFQWLPFRGGQEKVGIQTVRG